MTVVLDGADIQDWDILHIIEEMYDPITGDLDIEADVNPRTVKPLDPTSSIELSYTNEDEINLSYTDPSQLTFTDIIITDDVEAQIAQLKQKIYDLYHTAIPVGDQFANGLDLYIAQ